jgi:hypothetical protein
MRLETAQARKVTEEGRDEEEEWGRIPIPQSDDSYSTEGWLSNESEQEETTSTTKRERHEDNKKEYRNCYLAFMLGPRKDGRILNKDETILDVNARLTDNVDQQQDTHNAELPDPQENTARPH